MNRPQPSAHLHMIVEITFAADFDALTDAPIRAQLVRALNAEP